MMTASPEWDVLCFLMSCSIKGRSLDGLWQKQSWPRVI